MERGNHSSSSIQRNIKERNRRMYMKHQISQLASLIPPQTSKLSVAEILDQATNYIKQLQENEERLKRRKELLEREEITPCNTSTDDRTGSSKVATIIDIKHTDFTLEVSLICALHKNFMLYEVINVLQEEAAEVIEASQHYSGDKLIFMIKSKAICPRIGIEVSKIEQKLKELILSE